MKICERCGRAMSDGGLAYEVRIEVRADFDGVLPSPEEVGDIPGRQRRLLDLLARTDPEAAMEDVCHEERHLLCPTCRERFLANPLNRPLPEGRSDPPASWPRG